MPEVVVVRLSTDRKRFQILGGSSLGKDHVFHTVTKWPGWRRVAQEGRLEGRSTSIYVAPASPMTATTIAQSAFDLHFDNGAREAVEEHMAHLTRAYEALKSPLGEAPHPTDRKPMRHQTQAASAIVNLQGLALLSDDMGLGKSSTSLWAMNWLGVDRLLVLCPASVKFNWQHEVRETLGWHTWVIDGSPKKRASVFAEILHNVNAREALHNEGCAGMAVCINYDLLSHLSASQTDQLRAFVLGKGIICDESHYLKNRNSTRTKLTSSIAHGAKHRLLLTGTPVRNMVDDLYSQLEIVRPGSWTSYWDFAKRHLVTMPMTVGNKTFNKVRGSKDINGLNAVVNTMQIRRAKEDVLNLPPKIHTYPELELQGDHKRVYKAMKELAVLQLNELDDGLSIFAPQARSGVEAVMRCEQIAQGFCGGVPEPLVEKFSKMLGKQAEAIPGRPRELVFPESAKMLWLTEAIESLLMNKKRVAVLSRFNAPLFWLSKRFDEKAMVLTGAASSKQKHDTIESFQQGDFQVLLCQVKIAEGWNATTCHDVLFMGRDWSPAINQQAEGRFHRIGTKGTVNVQIPLVRDTIEIPIHKRLGAKDSDAKQALKTMTIAELKEAL